MFFCWFFTIIVTLILHYLWVKWNDGWNFPTWDDLVRLIMITHDMCWGDCPQYTYTCVYVCLFISMQGCVALKTTGLWMVLGTWQSCMLANTHWAVPKGRYLFLRMYVIIHHVYWILHTLNHLSSIMTSKHTTLVLCVPVLCPQNLPSFVKGVFCMRYREVLGKCVLSTLIPLKY